MNETPNEDSEKERAARIQRVAEAHRALNAAVHEYGEAKGALVGYVGAYVTGWALYGEYISPELVQNDATVGFTVVAPDQHGSTSRGLFEFGAENFNRSTVRLVKD